MGKFASHRDLLETWFRRVWNEGDVSAITDMLKTTTQAKGLGTQTLVGPDAFEGFHGLMNSLVANFHITLDHAVTEGDWISCLCTVTGNCPKTDKPVTMTGTAYARVDGDYIAEAYNHFDFLELYEQLGLLPDGTNGTCLSGEKIA